MLTQTNQFKSHRSEDRLAENPSGNPGTIFVRLHYHCVCVCVYRSVWLETDRSIWFNSPNKLLIKSGTCTSLAITFFLHTQNLTIQFRNKISISNKLHILKHRKEGMAL